MTWDVGDLVPLQTTLKVDGVLTDATMVLTVTDPAGSVTLPTVTRVSAGLYSALVQASVAGTWQYVWTASGTAVAVQPGQFDVEPLGLRLISLTQAKAHLNIPTSVTGDDEELREMLDAVTGVVEHYVGPVIPRTVTETVTLSGDSSVMALSYPPVISLTSVTALQTGFLSPAVSDLVADPNSGLVYPAAGRLTIPMGGIGQARGMFTVVYRAGRTPTPPPIRMAAKIILAHMWRTQHNQAGGRPSVVDEDKAPAGMGFAVPYQAEKFLEPYRYAPAIA